MRRKLWQLHSWLGLIAGLGLLVVGISGSVLMFGHELEVLANPALVRVEPTSTGRLPFETLRTEINRQLPGYEITGWSLFLDEPRRADVVYVIQHRTEDWLLVTVDPYTGALLASPRHDGNTLTGWMLELHFSFFAGHLGLFVVGLLGVMLCGLGITGVWIYRRFWKHVFTLRWRRGARILFSDFHKFVGITSCAFNFVLGFTGAWWNLTHVIGEELAGDPPPHPMEKRLYSDSLSLDVLARDAERRLPGFRTNYIELPAEPATTEITLWGAVEPHGILRSPYGTSIAYDAQTGAFHHLHDLRAQSAWAQAYDAFVPLHYGTFGGLPVKILWCLGGLTPGILAVTGFLIWRTRRRKTRPVSSAASTFAEPGHHQPRP